MTDPELLAQAKRGDVGAIATLLNRSLHSQGIWAQIERRDQTLWIALEAPQAPDPTVMEPRIRTGLQRLRPQGIATVMVQGWDLGEAQPTWERRVVLAAPPRPASPEHRHSLEHPHFPRSQGPAPAQPRPVVRPRTVVRRPSPKKPLVLKWSDFDPMMLAITGGVALYGFYGSLNPSYNGPFMWLHFPNLAIHETGHLLFMPFGEFLMLLGGSLTQILFPAAFTVYFFISQQYFSSALTLFWTGQNFMDVAVYMRDAPVRLLPLTVDNIDAHDWWQLFNRMGCLHQAELIANLTHSIGVVLYLASVIAGGYFAYRNQQVNRSASPFRK